MLAFNCHTAALASGGLSLLVPFFGGDDDIAALLLALAIMERDTSAELVVLSFLEPERNPSTQPGAGGNGNGNGNGVGVGVGTGAAASNGAGAEAASNGRNEVSQPNRPII